MSRPRGTNARRDRSRRKKAWPKTVDRANAEYDKLHGGVKAVCPSKPIGHAGTQAVFPRRLEHRLTPPWIALADDPPFPPPRQDLIALTQKCFPWERSP